MTIYHAERKIRFQEIIMEYMFDFDLDLSDLRMPKLYMVGKNNNINSLNLISALYER